MRRQASIVVCSGTGIPHRTRPSQVEAAANLFRKGRSRSRSGSQQKSRQKGTTQSIEVEVEEEEEEEAMKIVEHNRNSPRVAAEEAG